MTAKRVAAQYLIKLDANIDFVKYVSLSSLALSNEHMPMPIRNTMKVEKPRKCLPPFASFYNIDSS